MRRVIEWGADFVQIREKDLGDGDLYALVRRAVAMCQGTSCRIVVNGRADIAAAAGAHGVHLPAQGLTPSDLPPRLRTGLLVGVSVHSLDEALRAESAGADYVLLGPIFHPESKEPGRIPIGLKGLARACLRLAVPVLALGGILPGRFEGVMRAGAAGLAGISLFQRDFHELEGRPATAWRRRLLRLQCEGAGRD